MNMLSSYPMMYLSYSTRLFCLIKYQERYNDLNFHCLKTRVNRSRVLDPRTRRDRREPLTESSNKCGKWPDCRGFRLNFILFFSFYFKCEQTTFAYLGGKIKNDKHSNRGSIEISGILGGVL